VAVSKRRAISFGDDSSDGSAEALGTDDDGEQHTAPGEAVAEATQEPTTTV
jgi:hypothetical protein